MPANKPTAPVPTSNETLPGSTLPTVAPTRATRRHFDAAHKLCIARMIREDGLSLTKVCQDHDLTPSAVRRWVVQLGK